MRGAVKVEARVRGSRVRVCSAQGRMRARVRICARRRRPRTRHVRRIGHTDNLNGATLGGRDERTCTCGIEGDVLGSIRVPGSGLVVADPCEPIDSIALGRCDGGDVCNCRQRHDREHGDRDTGDAREHGNWPLSTRMTEVAQGPRRISQE